MKMILIFLGLFFMMSVQPMLMIVSLIFMTLFYSFMIYNFMGSYWYSYALVMIMLSGVLVVFTYMVSLIPNESFEVYNLIFVVIMLLIMSSSEMMEFMSDLSIFSLYLWKSYVGVFSLFLVVFLLSLMLMVIWLSMCKSGAIRVM